MGFKMRRSECNVSVTCLAFVVMLSVNTSAADISCKGPTLEQPGKEQCELVDMTNLSARNSLVFHAKGTGYVVLGLSDQPDPEAEAKMVWIGRLKNTWTSLSRFEVCGKTAYGFTETNVPHADALNPEEFRTFWLKWDDHNMTVGKGSTVGDSELVSHSFPTAMPIRTLFLSGYSGYRYQIYFDDPDGDSCNKELLTTTEETNMTKSKNETKENTNNSSGQLTQQETTESAIVNTVNTNNVSKTMESSETTSSNVQNSWKRAESAQITTESTTRSEKSQKESQESSRITTEFAAVNTESSSVKKDLDTASTKSTAKSGESRGVTLATGTETNTESETAKNKWDSDLATATINTESNTETQEKLAEAHKTYAPPAIKPLKFSRAQKCCNCILRESSTKNNENGTSPLDEEDKKKQEALSTAVKKELAVETKELSASVRKKVSTADKRPTTAVVGYVVAGVCFAPFGLIVLADIVNVFRYVHNAVKDKAN